MKREIWIAAAILALLLLVLGWFASRGGGVHEAGVESRSEPHRATNTLAGVSGSALPGEQNAHAGQAAAEPDPVFRGPCTVRGMVVDQAGKPVEGAMLEVLMEAVAPGDKETRVPGGRDPSWQEEDHVSNADGLYEFELDSHCPRNVAAVTQDDRRGECRVVLPKEGPIECMLVVEETWDLHGTVVDLDGVAVSGVRISASTDGNYQQYKALMAPESTDVKVDYLEVDPWGVWSRRDYSDEEGRFVLERLVADDWVLLVEHLDYQRVTVAVPEGDLRADEEVRLVVEPKDCWTVEVVDDLGRPVADAIVAVLPVIGREGREFDDATTDESGTIEACEVSSSNAMVMVRAIDHTVAQTHNYEGTDPLVVQVHGAGAVVGTLAVHAMDPPSSMRLHATECVRPDGSSCRRDFIFGPDCEPGPFRLEYIPAGELTLELGCVKGYKDGKAHGGTVERAITVRAGEVTDLGEVSFIDPEYSPTP